MSILLLITFIVSIGIAQTTLSFEPDGSIKYLVAAQNTVISNKDDESAFSFKIGNTCILIGVYNLKDKFEEDLDNSRIISSYEDFSTALGFYYIELFILHVRYQLFNLMMFYSWISSTLHASTIAY